MSKPYNSTYNLPAYAPNYPYLSAIVQNNICPRGSGAPYVTLSLYLCLYNINYPLNAWNENSKQKPIRKSIRTLEAELELPRTAINNGLKWLESGEWIDITMEKNTSVIYLNEDKIRDLIWQHWKRSQDPQQPSATPKHKPKPATNVEEEAEPTVPVGAVGYDNTLFPMSSASRKSVPFT